jgi:hypothetical protein
MKFLAFVALLFLMVPHTSEGARRMKEYPFPAYEYAFNKPVLLMFPLIKSNTIGVYYGLEDQEKVAELTLEVNEIGKIDFDFKGFDGYITALFPQVSTDRLTIIQKSSIGGLDFNTKEQVVDYRPKMPNPDVDNSYLCGKMIDKDNDFALSLHYPFITPENKSFYCHSLVLEDLKNKKVIKRIRVNEESRETIFLGKKFSYFLDCSSDGKTIIYNWRVVDDNLNFVDHPLVPILDEQWKTFYPDAILISESQECAIARGHLNADSTGKPFFQITPWIDKRPSVPIVLPDGQRPSQYISRETFLLSPSGKWLFFVAAKPGVPSQGPEHYYLMYIDKTLPNYYLPPIEIETGGEDFKVTWMQEPEGFVLWNGKHLRYWDLSKFDPHTLMKK